MCPPPPYYQSTSESLMHLSSQPHCEVGKYCYPHFSDGVLRDSMICPRSQTVTQEGIEARFISSQASPVITGLENCPGLFLILLPSHPAIPIPTCSRYYSSRSCGSRRRPVPLQVSSLVRCRAIHWTIHPPNTNTQK